MKRSVNALGKPNWRKIACEVLVLCATMAMGRSAQTFSTLHSFDGTDGKAPEAALVQASNGDLYGTTYEGGSHCAPLGCGTVFKITPSGTLTTLYSFSGATDGGYPSAGLVQVSNGDFYGTTTTGGASGYGTVFKLTPRGALTTLYSFCSQTSCVDGEYPWAGLVHASNGYYYGTTLAGGSHDVGTIFKITPGGTLTMVYSFCSQTGCTDGAGPYAALIQAADGDLYGTTQNGGTNCAPTGCGTVFKITLSGTLTTLYSFCSLRNCADGGVPTSPLVQTTNGDLYGTTGLDGANGDGTVFKMTPSGTLTTLYSFCSQIVCTDGAGPVAGLVRATNGEFYGTTGGGGTGSFAGTIFNISASGTLTSVYSFCFQGDYPVCPDGFFPSAGLIQATNGAFYGTTEGGGAYGNYGTVFSLSVGLGPFVETQPTSGGVGAAVRILGSDLTGATSVTFNGTAAALTVVSRFVITTTVPAGASSGRVEVVTPSRTLSSNVPFRVLP